MEQNDIINGEQHSVEPRRQRPCFVYEDRYRPRIRANDQGYEVTDLKNLLRGSDQLIPASIEYWKGICRNERNI
jgi:hypothetical protein